MDAMSYVNIFETKGVEYLLVICFLLGLVCFLRVLSHAGAATGAVSEEGREPGLGQCPAGDDCPFVANFQDYQAGEEECAEPRAAALGGG